MLLEIAASTFSTAESTAEFDDDQFGNDENPSDGDTTSLSILLPSTIEESERTTRTLLTSSVNTVSSTAKKRQAKKTVLHLKSNRP